MHMTVAMKKSSRRSGCSNLVVKRHVTKDAVKPKLKKLRLILKNRLTEMCEKSRRLLFEVFNVQDKDHGEIV